MRKPAERLARLSVVNRHALAAIGLTVLAAAGCGGNSKQHAAANTPKPHAPATSRTACDPGDDSCIPPDHPSTSAQPVPVLAVGRSMPLQLPTSSGTVQARITLTGLKVKNGKTLCFAFKLRNTDSKPFPDDGPGLSWKWFGLDGAEADTDPGTAGMCDELGHEFAGMDQPAPQPGKYAAGYYSTSVPAKPGALEVTDSDGSPLFRLNYGPQSAKVQIDARGQ